MPKTTNQQIPEPESEETVINLAKHYQSLDDREECLFFLGNGKVPSISFKGQQFSDKQVTTMELLAHGYSNTEIANMMAISPRTVETHISCIRKILGSSKESRLGDRKLVLYALEMIEGYQHYLRNRFANSLYI